MNLLRIAQSAHNDVKGMAASRNCFETFRVAEGAAAELERIQASFYENFDTFVTISNSLTNTYHTMVQIHENCERIIKDITTPGASNHVTINVHNVQNVQTQKAQIERDMLELEKLQCETWKTIQALHEASKWTARESCELRYAKASTRHAFDSDHPTTKAAAREHEAKR